MRRLSEEKTLQISLKLSLIKVFGLCKSNAGGVQHYFSVPGTTDSPNVY